jgi:hypothetical protein
MRQRGGPLRFIQINDTSSKTWKQILAQNLHSDPDLVMTDESSAARAAIRADEGLRLKTPRDPPQHREIRRRDNPHEHSGVRIFTAQTRDHRQLSPRLDKAFAEVPE